MSFSIPVYRPSLRGNEKKYVLDCLESTWISSKGKYVSEFEGACAAYLGVGHAAGVCNGTAAVHVALLALGIGPGDEVLVPTFTYVASVNAIAYLGAKPVFVDSDRDTWQMDPADAERKITPATRAILCVHLYGHPCDMEALASLSQRRGLFLVEDCAEAFGSRFHGRLVGGFGHVSCFSFFGNKTITTGEGGLVATNIETLHQRVLSLKGQGLAKHREYWHDVVGYNYRMTNIEAAIGLAQLERIEELLAAKRRVAAWYDRELAGVPVTAHAEQPGTFHTYWMYTVLAASMAERDALRAHLEEAGIETRPTFFPVHTMPMYAARFQHLPVAEDLALRGVNLPSYPDLSEDDVKLVSSRIRSFYAKERASR